jgi:hypothetical protein
MVWRAVGLAAVVGVAAAGLLLPSAIATTSQPYPRQAIKVSSDIRTAFRGHEIVGLGFTNVSTAPATLLVSLKDHLPLTRGQVVLNSPGARFANGTITVPLPANHAFILWNLELKLPLGSAGKVEVDLRRNFGTQGTPYSEIATIAFGF